MPHSLLQTILHQSLPGIKALLAMVVGEWRLPAAGQGRVCAGTLGLLLDPGGGAVESYCGGGRRQSRATECHRGRSKSFQHLLLSENQLGSPVQPHPLSGSQFSESCSQTLLRTVWLLTLCLVLYIRLMSNINQRNGLKLNI